MTNTKHIIPVTGLACLLLAAACQPGSEAEPASVGSSTHALFEDLALNVPKARLDVEFYSEEVLQQYQLNLCPNGGDLTVLTQNVCLEPLLLHCTYYYCGTSLSPMFNPNPDCHPAAFQTDECTNSLPEVEVFEFDYWMDPPELHERVPTLFGKEFTEWEVPQELPGQ